MHPALSPYIRVAWYDTLQAHTVIGPRDIFDYEMLYLKEGEALITVQGRPYQALPGDVFLLRPNQRHEIRCLNDYPVIQPHVHFDLEYREDREEVYIPFIPFEEMEQQDLKFFRRDILDQFYPHIPPRIHLKQSRIFEEYLFDLIDEHDHPSAFNELRQSWLFLRLFDLYLREAGYFLHVNGSGNAEILASRIKMYLENNSARHVSLDELVDTVHVDKSYLISIFKKVYHETPLVYHQKVRIKRARNMLMYTNLTITEIAASTGFSSIHDFDRVFRKIDGAAPSSYRPKK